MPLECTIDGANCRMVAFNFRAYSGASTTPCTARRVNDARAVCQERAVAHGGKPFAERQAEDLQPASFCGGKEWPVAAGNEAEHDLRVPQMLADGGGEVQQAPLGTTEATARIQEEDSHRPA
jgi:hypothetical protein